MKREKDGASRLEHLKSVSSRVKVPELDYPDADETMAYLLNHFYQVKRAQGERISYLELGSYSSIMSYNLSSWECEIIMLIDKIYEASVNG